MSKSYND